VRSTSKTQQKYIYEDSEGDSWFARNIEKLENKSYFPEIEFLVPYISPLPAAESNINFLEIGCGSGHRIHNLAQRIQSNGWGIDPSKDAIKYANINFASEKSSSVGQLTFIIGTADYLPFPNNFFDLVYFGFCLYVIDRELIDKVKFESNRVLKSGGKLAILDFDSVCSYEKKNIHHDALKTYKYAYETLFLDMGYQLVAKMSLTEGGEVGFEEDTDKRIALHLLHKP